MACRNPSSGMTADVFFDLARRVPCRTARFLLDPQQ
jgi:hypothetical protein